MDGIDKPLLVQCRDEIINWFEHDYSSTEGFPFFKIDALTGKPLSSQNILTDLGDYLPFFLWCGKGDYVERHINLAQDFFEKVNIILYELGEVPGVTLKHRLRRLILGYSTLSFEYSDLLLGLIECYEIKRDQGLLDFIDFMIDKIYALFFTKNNLACVYYPRVKYKLPVAKPTNGIFIEQLIDLYRLTGHRKYLDKANQLLNPWLDSEFFRETGLFPSQIFASKLIPKNWSGNKNPHRTAYLTKDNYCMAAAVLALFSLSHEPPLNHALINWFDGVTKYFIDENGGVYQWTIIESPDRFVRGPLTSKSYAVVDFCCDYTWSTGDGRYIKTAERIAEFYLSRQSKETGLLPTTETPEESYFDDETDFAISLMKLYELTGKEIYKEAAIKIFNGQIKYHHTARGYVNRVNIYTGEVTENIIESRYCSLFLKLILLFLEERRIYADPVFMNLLRDR